MCLLELILSIGCFAERYTHTPQLKNRHTPYSLNMRVLEVYLRQPTRTDVCEHHESNSKFWHSVTVESKSYKELLTVFFLVAVLTIIALIDQTIVCFF